MTDPIVRMEFTRLESVRRLLNAAVELYFSDGDYLAIHTLAASVYEVTKDILGKAQGTSGLLLQFDSITDKKERKKAIDFFRAPQNFLKHANLDPDLSATITYFPAVTELMLYECCHYFKRHDPSGTQLCAMYIGWYCAWNKQFRSTYEGQGAFSKFEEISTLYTINERQQFYAAHWERLDRVNVPLYGNEVPILVEALQVRMEQ